MRILNLGSLNVDRTYGVDHFAAAGETLLASAFERTLGGKGLNQSVALARAGVQVFHAGAVGLDGEALRKLLQSCGVNTRYLKSAQIASGHAIVQVNPRGQNCIIVYGGANTCISPDYIDEVLGQFSPGDLLLLQNEISCVEYAMRSAKARGILIAFNASPITGELKSYPLALADYLIVNEVEAAALTSSVYSKSELLQDLCRRYPDTQVILTVGERGAYWGCGEKWLHQCIYPSEVVDTTGAGDTFCGYFLSAMFRGWEPACALRLASVASSLTVGRHGAAASIPTMAEVAARAYELGIFEAALFASTAKLEE